MGSYDGAETCELAGSFLLSQLQELNTNIGLYRDDGLVISDTTPRDTENFKKEICRIFNHNGLRITIEANKQTINFLDVTFNPNKNNYQPFAMGALGFSVLRFGYFLDGFFGFCVFFGFGSLRFADFLSFSIWFSVFTKNTNGLSDLISDTVFGFSYLTYLGSGFSSI